jgi:dUTP pyrophosphatase
MTDDMLIRVEIDDKEGHMKLSKIIPLKLKRLHNDAIEPEYKSSGASGFDLFACCEAGERFILSPKGVSAIPTGWAVEIPEGFELQIRPRSGIALKRQFIMPNAPGTIDCDYRGEVKVLIRNLSSEYQSILHGERIAQAVVAPVYKAAFEIVEELSSTDRGAGGFGSTGNF